jgi:hypothetical protein
MGTAESSADLPEWEFGTVVVEVLASAAIVLVVLAGLWPPEHVYWTAVADVIGDPATLVLVGSLAVGIGIWVCRTTDFDVRVLVLGSVLAFGVGMGAIQIVFKPDSPAHLLWYGALTACILGGAIAWTAVDRYRAPA